MTYLSDGLVDLLLVRVHLGEGTDLGQVHVLSVAERHDLVEGEDKWKGLVNDL